MIKSGRVVDSKTGGGIPYANIELHDANGVYLGAGAAANSFGFFSLDSTLIRPGSFLRVSSAGYQTQSIPFETFVGQNTFALNQDIKTLPDVVITATKTENKNNKVYAGLGLAALLLLLLKAK